MEENNLAAVDDWLGDNVGLDVSQPLVLPDEDTQGNNIVEEAEVFAAVDGPALIDDSQQEENTNELLTEPDSQFPTQEANIPVLANSPTLNKEKVKRNTQSFANRFLIAKSDLFLNPVYSNQFNNPTMELVGQVKACPRESNGRQYRIEWKHPLPERLQREWLRCNLHATKELKEKLVVGMTAYDNSEAGRKKAAMKEASTTKDKTRAQDKGDGVGNRDGDERPSIQEEYRTPAPVQYVTARAATVASIRTSSTISTLSQNSITSPENLVTRGGRTRRTNDLESSSDDGDELDEEDNMYNQEMSDMDYSDSEEEDDDEDDATSEHAYARDLLEVLDQIQWNFSPIDDGYNDADGLATYNGPSCLKPRVAESFNTPFECLEVCGGLDYEFVNRLARNSNEYVRKHLLPKNRNGRLHGVPFVNITTEEMYHFLGITLRISLSPVDWGGYEAYFSSSNRRVMGLEITGSDGFARHFMTLNRYKQIRSAFHPEDRSAGLGGDKCYQLRHAINTLNQAAMNTKFMGEDLTFDEGGIGSRHRMNPVRQYNKDKPQKFRVDFFILACSRSYFIHHLDVYQGKNAANINIHRAVRSMPTTQKAVLNAVLQTNMHQEVEGARHISLDNRYQCPQLALLLRQKFKINSTGTCRKNRKGWDKEQMNMKKTKGRGAYKIIVDKDNKILCCQWVDSKVVNVVSSLLVTEISKVKRQVGSQKKEYDCPWVLTKYQKNMLGVDKSDQMRAAGGGFAAKAHYKKWYKRVYFAILDMMTLNALIAWNLSAKQSTNSHRPELKRHEFLWYISQCILEYKDETNATNANTATTTAKESSVHSVVNLKGHQAIPCTLGGNAKCAICKLDHNVQRLAIKDEADDSTRKGLMQQSLRHISTQLSTCTKCRITAHPTIPPNPRKIHSIAAFRGLTCFQIAHTQEGYEVWKRTSAGPRAYNP
jgi:Transposase IS4